MIGICAGILLVGLTPVSLPGWLLVIVLVCLLLIMVTEALLWLRCKRVLRQLAGILLGVLYASGWGCWQISERLPFAAEPVDLVVSGYIASIPRQLSGLQRFDFILTAVHSSAGSRGESAEQRPSLHKVRLSWYRSDLQLMPGQEWRFSVRLKPVHGFKNPGAADYEARMLSMGIGAVGYVRNPRQAQFIGSRWSIDRVRYRFGQWLASQPLSSASQATLNALLLGDKNGLKQHHWALLADTGTVHLVVISGLHIGLVCLLGYLIGAFLQRGLLLCRVVGADIRGVKVVPALSLALLYAALAGFSIPTQRALIMAAALMLPALLGRQAGLWRRYLIALTLVLLLQPLAFYQAGFWLSFGAVAVLIAAFSVTGAEQQLLQRLLSCQWVVFAGLLPLLVAWLGSISLSAPLVNLIAVPFVSFVLLPGSVLGILLLWFDPGAGVVLLDALVALFWYGLEQMNHQLPGRLTLNAPDVLVVALAFIGVLLLVQPRVVVFRWIGFFLLLPLFFPAYQRPSEGHFSATVIDVGQGMSVLVQTRDHALLFDTGRGYRGGGSVAPLSVLPVLRNSNLSRLDRLVVSHGDNDHAGGYADISAGIDIGRLETGSNRWLPFRAVRCRAGERWRWNGVEFSYLQPEDVREDNENNRSCVLMVRSAGCSLLIPGDIEASVERQIVAAGVSLQAHWLIAAHHGSSTSSTAEWLTEVAPEVVIFSAGLNNRYGHPARSVIGRVEASGARWLNTASVGAVLLNDGLQGCRERGYRDMKKRYWSAG